MEDSKTNTNFNNFIEEDSIDIMMILKKIWISRKIIIKITSLFFFIGCFFALLSPVVYTSETTFVPQASDDELSSAKLGLGSLASLAGINFNSSESNSDSYLSPLLYSKIAESEEFSVDLIEEEITDLSGNNFTIKEYLLSNKSSFNFYTLVNFVKKYSIDLFTNNENLDYNNDIIKKYNFLNDEDFELILDFKEKFAIELDEKQGFLKVIATDNDAFISTQLVEKITKNLQSKIIELRTIKIRERLEYSKKQYESKQLEFDILHNELAEFKDSNKNISTARFMSELQKLESAFQLQENILINLASEYNNNKIKLNKDTPIFSVIDEVSVPNEKTKPKRILIIITFGFIGLVISTVYMLSKENLINLIKEIVD